MLLNICLTITIASQLPINHSLNSRYYQYFMYSHLNQCHIQGFLDGPLLVKTSIIPLRTISLDRTHCIVPEFPTIAMPTRFPPPDPAPSNAPTVCQSLSETAQTAFSNSPILHCQLKEACDSGLACILDIGQSEYSVDIELTRSSVVLTVSSVDGDKVYGEVRNQNTSVVLPNPEGTALMFNQTVDNKDTVGFSVSDW